METIAVVLSVGTDHVEAFEAGFRAKEVPVWNDLAGRGLLLNASLSKLEISSRPGCAAVPDRGGVRDGRGPSRARPSSRLRGVEPRGRQLPGRGRDGVRRGDDRHPLRLPGGLTPGARAPPAGGRTAPYRR